MSNCIKIIRREDQKNCNCIPHMWIYLTVCELCLHPRNVRLVYKTFDFEIEDIYFVTYKTNRYLCSCRFQQEYLFKLSIVGRSLKISPTAL